MATEHYIRIRAEAEHKNQKAWARRAGRNLADVPSVEEIFDYLWKAEQAKASGEGEPVSSTSFEDIDEHIAEAEEEEVEEEEAEEEAIVEAEEEEVQEEEVPSKASDVVAAIEVAETIEEVDALSEGDDRKTVVAAAEKRRLDLEDAEA